MAGQPGGEIFAAAINIIALSFLNLVTAFKILGTTRGAGYGQWILSVVVNVAALSFTGATSPVAGDGKEYQNTDTSFWSLRLHSRTFSRPNQAKRHSEFAAHDV